MYNFKPYLHVERLDKDECAGLLQGQVYITAKLDGTNAVVWADDNGIVHCGSRTRELSLGNDNAGFMAWIMQNSPGTIQEKIHFMCQDNPHLLFYGEWGCGRVGAIKKYDKIAQNRLWFFDAYNRNADEYVRWDRLCELLDIYGLDDYKVELLATLQDPSPQDIIDLANNNHFLLDDETLGEGVVCKNYDFINKYGRYTVGKYVLDTFRPHKSNRVITPGEIEQMFVDKYITVPELDKAKAKTELYCGEDYDQIVNKNKFIGVFINIIWKDTLEENIVDFLKKQHNPVIDFGNLNSLCKQVCRKYLGLV